MYWDQSFPGFFLGLLYTFRQVCDRGGFATRLNAKAQGCQERKENYWMSRFQPFIWPKQKQAYFKKKLFSNLICCYCSLWIPLQMSQEFERYFSGNTHKQINKLSQAEDNLNIWEPAQACQASHRHSRTGKINLQPPISLPESRSYITHPLYGENGVLLE